MSRLQVIQQLHGEQLTQLYRLFQNEWWTQQREMVDIPSLIEQSDLIVALWDEEQGKLVGFSRVLTDFLYRAFICDVIVDRSVRGLGLGKRLMEEILKRLQHVERIELYCQQKQTSFYQKMGFSELETTHLMRLNRDAVATTPNVKTMELTRESL